MEEVAFSLDCSIFANSLPGVLLYSPRSAYRLSCWYGVRKYGGIEAATLLQHSNGRGAAFFAFQYRIFQSYVENYVLFRQSGESFSTF